jgi:hypothetical protein
MCDYSLHSYDSRPAKVGDRLTAYHFGSGTTGFVEADSSPEGKVAICLLPGTEVAFTQSIKVITPLEPQSLADLGTRVAIFRQINKDQQLTHHDALETPDGEVLLLNWLVPGQQASVLQMPVMETPAQIEAAKRLPAPDVLFNRPREHQHSGTD